MRLIAVIRFSLMCILILSACTKVATDVDSSTHDKQNELTYARGLQIFRDGNSYIAKIVDPGDTTNILATYVFPDSDTTKVTTKYNGAIVIRPGKLSLFVYTSVHASALEELGEIDQVKMVVDAQYFQQKAIINGLKNGSISNAGNSASPVIENILHKQPDLAIVSVYDGMNVNVLEHTGTPIVYMAENMESTPLGRAEWIKFLGLLSGKKEKADSIFRCVERNYIASKKAARNAKTRPNIMLETMYQGIWYMAGGNSCQARLIEDAGGAYVFDNNGSKGGIPLSFEQVLSEAATANIWLIHLYDRELTKNNLIAEDERYALFASFVNNRIWSSNSAVSRVFEDASFHPDKILKDYLIIFHPELSKSGTPKYYKNIR